MHKILLTCPPMIGMMDAFEADFEKVGFDIFVPEFTQVMSEEHLKEIIGDFDGWIIGDDPATAAVLTAGREGKLKACMRWGVGTDNVDFKACKELAIPIENTPGVFGREVADLAMHYVTALARKTFEIDRQVKRGNWYKPIGKSLWSSTALVVGFGDIGKNVAKRLLAHEVEVSFFDPFTKKSQMGCEKVEDWHEAVSNKDFLVFTAPQNDATFHMFNLETLDHLKPKTKIVNVGRGSVLSESAICVGLDQGIIESAALDVLEKEPLMPDNKLLEHNDRLIFGSHNGSNTSEAVLRVSRIVIQKLSSHLKQYKG